MNKFKAWIQNRNWIIQIVLIATVAALIISVGCELFKAPNDLLNFIGLMVLSIPVTKSVGDFLMK